jgi:hypothetical protein
MVEWGWPGPLILGNFLVVSGAAFTGILYGTAVVLMLLGVLVALIAAMGTAWRVSSEKPLNRLRSDQLSTYYGERDGKTDSDGGR